MALRKAVPLAVPFIAMVLILMLGFTLRIEDLSQWRESPGRAFLQNKPLLTAYDGYYYLNLSRDLLQESYEPIDAKRGVPSGHLRPFPPPLLSVLGTLIAKVTNLSLDWIGVFLPAFLGVLLALPLFFLGRNLGGVGMGLVSALFCLALPEYIYRSGFGWFDTDCLNVTFVLFTAFFFLKFGEVKSLNRYLYLLSAFVSAGLFYWWWDSASAIVIFTTLINFLVVILFFYRPASKIEGLLFSGLLLSIIILAISLIGFKSLIEIRNSIRFLVNFLSIVSNHPMVFPSIASSISELSSPSFSEVVYRTSGSVFVFFAAILGLISIVMVKPRQIFYLIVPGCLGVLGVFYAMRFLIFLVPIVAFGLGALVHSIWKLRKKITAAYLLTPILLIFLFFPSFKINHQTVFWPKEPPSIVSGMIAARLLTPESSIIWTWWDHGYAMRYWADRGVITDGGYISGELAYYNALPLAVDDERLAANFIRFYSVRGKLGMNKLFRAFNGDHATAMRFLKSALAGGPNKVYAAIDSFKLSYSYPIALGDHSEEWKDFLYPGSSKPVYLFLDWRLTQTIDYWFRLGTWDFAKLEGKKPSYDLFLNLKIKENHIKAWKNNRQIVVDRTTGDAKTGARKASISRISISDEKNYSIDRHFQEEGLDVEISTFHQTVALMDRSVSDSVFNRLFHRQQDNSGYFKSVARKFRAWHLWEVMADKP